MKLCGITQALDRIAPPPLAEAWDNVGLLVGEPAADVANVMLAIDYTSAVAAEAASKKCELFIA